MLKAFFIFFCVEMNRCFLKCFLTSYGGWKGGGVDLKRPQGGGPSEAFRLLQEAGLGGQRHEGRGQTSEAHPRAKVEVRGGK